MEDKKQLLNEIKELWKSEKIQNFDIAPELLEYLELKDLQELKERILNSMSNLSQEQKEWLFQFRKYEYPNNSITHLTHQKSEKTHLFLNPKAPSLAIKLYFTYF